MVDSLSMMSSYPEKIAPIKKASLLKLRKEADKDPPHDEAAIFRSIPLCKLTGMHLKKDCHSLFINRRKVASVNFFQLNHDLFGFRCRNVFPDIICSDRQLSVAAVDKHRELDG